MKTIITLEITSGGKMRWREQTVEGLRPPYGEYVVFGERGRLSVSSFEGDTARLYYSLHVQGDRLAALVDWLDGTGWGPGRPAR